MTDWGTLIEAQRAKMLDAPDAGFGHAVAHFYHLRQAYRWAVCSANQDHDLTMAVAEHYARAARALFAAAEPLGGEGFLRSQLSWDDRQVRHAQRWATGTDEQLEATIQSCRASGVPLRPSMLRVG